MDIRNRIIVNKYKNTVCVTKWEKKVRRYLTELKVYHEPQYAFEYKNSFIMVDIIIPQSRLIIEVDGKHHYKGEKLIEDIERDNFLKNLGFKVMRIMNDELKEMTLEQFKERIFCKCCNWLNQQTPL